MIAKVSGYVLLLTIALAATIAIPASPIYPQTALAATSSVDFESPNLGTANRQEIDPYVDTSTGVQFTAAPGSPANAVVGLVKNGATSACLKPPDDNQLLGTGTAGSDNIGRAGSPIEATFPSELAAGASVSVRFQSLAGQPVRVRLFDAIGNEVASTVATAGPADGKCGSTTGDPRASTVVAVNSDQPVASVIMDMDDQTGSFVFVIDDFEYEPNFLVLYGVDSSTDGIYTIDVVTGARTDIGRMDPSSTATNVNPNRFATPQGLTIDPGTGPVAVLEQLRLYRSGRCTLQFGNYWRTGRSGPGYRDWHGNRRSDGFRFQRYCI